MRALLEIGLPSEPLKIIACCARCFAREGGLPVRPVKKKAPRATRGEWRMFLVKQRDCGVPPMVVRSGARELVLRRAPVHKVRMKPCERQALP